MRDIRERLSLLVMPSGSQFFVGIGEVGPTYTMLGFGIRREIILVYVYFFSVHDFGPD